MKNTDIKFEELREQRFKIKEELMNIVYDNSIDKDLKNSVMCDLNEKLDRIQKNINTLSRQRYNVFQNNCKIIQIPIYITDRCLEECEYELLEIVDHVNSRMENMSFGDEVYKFDHFGLDCGYIISIKYSAFQVLIDRFNKDK